MMRRSGRAKSTSKSNTKRGKAKGKSELFAFGNSTTSAVPSSTGRPKRKLKAVLRFDQVQFDNKKQQGSCKIGHGFNCPRCSYTCSYDSKVCGECQLECCYEAGIGVVTLKERCLDDEVQRKTAAIKDEENNLPAPAAVASDTGEGASREEPLDMANNDEAVDISLENGGSVVFNGETDAGHTNHSNHVISLLNQNNGQRNTRLGILANPKDEHNQTMCQTFTTSHGGNNEALPPELAGLDIELIERINNQIVDLGDPVLFDDVVGLEDAKRAMNEMLVYPLKRPDLFQGLRALRTKGLLLFGPPGTGKTLIAKAIAHESGATLFSISSSSITSKWLGEGEQLVRTLFAVAAYRSPSVVFIDEMDFMLTQDTPIRRMRSEFCVQLDGANSKSGGQTLFIGSTNKPWLLDADIRRRFAKRLYIPLPNQAGRETIIKNLLRRSEHALTENQMTQLSHETYGYSGSDLKCLCEDAAMGPIRRGFEELSRRGDSSPIMYRHFRFSLEAIKPSVTNADVAPIEKWNAGHGSKIVMSGDDDSDQE